MNEKAPAPNKPLCDPATSVLRRVLLIDDNEDGANLLAMLLDRMGCHTRVCTTGSAGLEMGAAFNPEVVLLDLNMRPMDGHETCQRMRSAPWGAAARIYAYTAHIETSVFQRARTSGFDGYLVKPVCKTVLASAVSGQLTTDWAQPPEGLLAM